VRRYNLSILFLLFLVPLSVKGQYDPSFSHYWAMEPSFNPASVGKESKLNINGAYAMDLVGFEHNPRTMYIAADMPFYFMKSYHGVGAIIQNDQIGLFNHKKFALQYAYRFKLFKGMLGVGAQLGMISETFDGSGLDLEESTDPAFTKSSINGSGFDFGVGLYYVHRSWYVGASVQHVTSPLIDLGETNELQIDRTYYFTGGYNIKLRNPFITLYPSMLLRTDGVGYRADITGRLVYTNDNKVMYGGLAYSPTNSITVLIGGNFHGVSLGYSYEIYTSAIKIGNGSHELFVGYQTDINLQKKGKNKHKSVRIL
jgi:type IX secretion system PorP/SprF family membrane protein